MSGFLRTASKMLRKISEDGDVEERETAAEDGSDNERESVVSLREASSRCVLTFPISVERGLMGGIGAAAEQSREFQIDIFNGEIVEYKDGSPIKFFLMEKILESTVYGKSLMVKKVGAKRGNVRTKKYKFMSDEHSNKFHFYVFTRNLFGVHIKNAFIKMADKKHLYRASYINIDKSVDTLEESPAMSTGDLSALNISPVDLKQALLLADLYIAPTQVTTMIEYVTRRTKAKVIDFVAFYHLLWKTPVYSDRECLLQWMKLASVEMPIQEVLADDAAIAVDSESNEGAKAVSAYGQEIDSLKTLNDVERVAAGNFGLVIDSDEMEFLPGEDVMVKYEAVRAQIDAGKASKSSALTLSGTLFITNFRLAVVSNVPSATQFGDVAEHSRYWHMDVTPYWEVFNIPLTSILSPSVQENICTIWTKDLRCVRLTLPPSDQMQTKIGGLVNFISSASFPGSQDNLFCFHYQPKDYEVDPDTPVKASKWESRPLPCDPWKFTDIRREYERMGISSHSKWRLFDNSDFSLANTYPPYFGIPRGMTDGEIKAAASFRSKNRLPVITYRHAQTGSVMCRSSQPLVGLSNNSSEEDILLLKSYRKYVQDDGLPFYILDARGFMAATANRAAGKGTEDKTLYPNTALEFQNVGNIHTMRKSVNDLAESVCPGGYGEDNSCLYSKIEASGWLQYLSHILQAALNGAERLHVQRASILTHCSDGWDRTSQICALIKIILDPYYRTIEGLAALIEMEWCAFGFKFAERLGCGMDPQTKPDERSPVFLQFIDCIYQILVQYPAAFEYNEELLVFVADHVHSSMFGNFLGNTYQERHETLKVKEKTTSIWQYVFHNCSRFCNPLYQEVKSPIWPCVSLKIVRLWRRYFLRWGPEAHPRPGSGAVWDDSY